MAITVNTNIYSMNSQRGLARTQGKLSTAMQQLSSGLRINQAKDDAAGLGVGMVSDSQARGFAVAQRTIGDGMSYADVADAALRSIDSTLQRMRELAVQHASGTYSSTQKTSITTEFDALKLEVAAIQTRAKFNGSAVFGASHAVVAGANGETITVAASSVTATATIGSLTNIDADIATVATRLSGVGAAQSRLERALDGAMAMEAGQRAAYGRVMDADFARATMNMTSAQVVQQAGVSALSQANAIPQMALGLLR